MKDEIKHWLIELEYKCREENNAFGDIYVSPQGTLVCSRDLYRIGFNSKEELSEYLQQQI
jgi:hypothetical protein